MYNQTELEQYVGHGHQGEIANISQGDTMGVNFKNPKVALLLSILVGIFAIDRLYQGGPKMLLMKLAMIILTFGTWYIADIYFCRKMVQLDNFNKLMATASV